MGDFASTAWGQRLHDPQRPGARLVLQQDDTAGFVYVAGRLLATKEAAGVLELDLNPLDYVEVPSGALDVIGIREYAYIGGSSLPLPLLAAVLRMRAKRSAPPGAQLDDYDVALHYGFTGNPAWVPGGHPFGAPGLVDAAAPSRVWPGGDPLVAVVDTGLDLTSATGRGYPADPNLLLDPDRDQDLLRMPGQPTPELAAQAGHGTFITSLIGHQSGGLAGVVNARALDPDGIGTEVQLLEALHRVVTRFPQIPVINLSLGGYTDGADYGGIVGSGGGSAPDTVPLAVGRWLRWFTTRHNKDAVVVCAAGNYGLSRPFWPAADPHAIAVASLNGDAIRSTFSDYGPWVDVATFGERVLGDHPEGPVVDEQGAVVDFSGQAAVWSGTSFAAPVLAAELARRLASAGPGASARDVWQSLSSSLPTYSSTAEPLGKVWDPRTLGAAFDPYSL